MSDSPEGRLARLRLARHHTGAGEIVKASGPAIDRRLVALLAITAMAYLPCVGNGYVWDDIPLIVGNALFKEPFDPATAFFTDLWSSAAIGDEAPSGYFRPVMVASLWLDHVLSGGAAFAHLHSLCWHLLAVWAALRLGCRVVGEPVGWVGAIWFAIHPLQTEAVYWVAARNDLMAAALGLLALSFVCEEKPRRGWALLAAAGAMGSKESVVLLPVVAAGLLWWSPKALCTSLGDGLRRVVPLVAGVAILVGLRIWVDVGGARGPSVAGSSLVLSSLPDLVGWVGWKLVVPWPLSIGHVLEYLDRQAVGQVVAGWAVLLMVGGGVVARGSRVSRIGLVWAVLFGMPVFWALASTGWMGERYLYLPILGVGWMGGGLTARWGAKAARAWIGVGLIWAALVSLRAGDWASDDSLWSSAWETTPSPFTAEGLGHVRRGSSGPEEATIWFVRALDDAKPLSTGCVPLMRSAVGTRKMVRAAHLGAWASARGCGGPEFDGWRAITLASTGRWDLLAALLERASPDREGRLTVAHAALLLHRQDESGLQALEASWMGSRPLRGQAEELWSNSEKHEPVVLPLPTGG